MSNNNNFWKTLLHRNLLPLSVFYTSFVVMIILLKILWFITGGFNNFMVEYLATIMIAYFIALALMISDKK